VTEAFGTLVHGAMTIETTPQILSAAHDRKLCGQPPTTPGRDTIGDEINWESLVVGCKEDLAIVTLDHDYLDHVELLRTEYHRRTNKLLLRVGRKLAPILAEFGERSDAVEAAEQNIHGYYRCKNCGAMDWQRDGERDPKYGTWPHRCGNCKVSVIHIA
jgi:hypothetical protein